MLHFHHSLLTPAKQTKRFLKLSILVHGTLQATCSDLIGHCIPAYTIKIRGNQWSQKWTLVQPRKQNGTVLRPLPATESKSH